MRDADVAEPEVADSIKNTIKAFNDGFALGEQIAKQIL